jgi:hypothetical protein
MEVSNLLEIASLSLGRPPKRLVLDAINDHLRPIRSRRDELAKETGRSVRLTPAKRGSPASPSARPALTRARRAC